MDLIRASIIVVTYNSQPFLEQCLGSILAELSPRDELIIIDNGSNDGTVEYIRVHFPIVRLILNQNAGYAGGNNRGAAAARGEYLVFLNPDTRLQPGALSAILAPLASNTDVALTTACIVFMNRPDVINTCGNTMHYTGLTYCRGARFPRKQYMVSSEVDAVSGAAFATRRKVFTELGGFDPHFFMYVEDTDLSWRARLAGYRCLYVADAIVEHDYHPSLSPEKAYYLDRNRHLMLLKNLSYATYLLMLPGLILAEIVTGGFLIIKGPRYWSVKPRVYRWLWMQREEIRRVRREAQFLRRRTDIEVVGQLTHRLEFEQMAFRPLARLAAILFHPAFWAARRLFVGGRS